MRSLRWSAALVTVLGLALLFLMPERAVIARRASAPTVGVARLEVFHTTPVLVRAGEEVRLPVDVVCAAADGSACPATAVLRLRERGSGWRTFRAPANTGLRFDLSAPLGRALNARTGSGSIAFRVSARAASGRATATATGPSRALRVYVAEHLPTVRVPAVPFGRVRRGREVLFLPWGTGSLRAGLRPGNESPTLGPSSFDVGRQGAIVLVDSLQARVAEFRGDRLVRQVPLSGSSWADVAVARDGTAYLASRGAGSSFRGTVRAIGPRGDIRVVTKHLPGMPSEIEVAGGAAFVRVLPLDAWVAIGGREATRRPGTTMGRPLGRRSQLLVSGTDDRIRIGTVNGNRVRRALELVPDARDVRFGDVALAEADGVGGFVIAVHVHRDRSGAPDRYQVIRVDRSLHVRTFLTAGGGYATSMALSRFRAAPDGALYQLRTEPDGVHVVRYGSGRRSS